MPFIARYRKEATGGLDEVEIKQIDDEYRYMENLQKEKDEVIHSIDEQQGMLTEDLKKILLNRQNYKELKIYTVLINRKTRATEAKKKRVGAFSKMVYFRKI